MRYFGTEKMETIAFQTEGEHPEVHFVTLGCPMYEPLVEVTCCCDESWRYLFALDSPSDYERLKYDIMEAAAYSQTTDVLMGELDAIFAERYGHLMIEFDEGESQYMN